MADDMRDYMRQRVVEETVRLGFPEEFGQLVAEQLGGEWSCRRMLGYLTGAQPRSMEDVADEMLAILADRQRIVETKRADQSTAAVTAFYNRPGREA